jgi:hypothetical protein
MQQLDHPAHRSTRYHWAAGLNPLHWVPALGGWLAVILLGMTAPLVPTVASFIPFILLLTLAWSGLWLLVVPMTRRFRRATDARLRAAYEGDYDYQLVGLLEKIDADLRSNVSDIGVLRNKAREILQGKFGDSDPFARDNLAKLDTLAISYLQMLAALSEYDQYVRLVDPAAIERDLLEARQSAASGDSSLSQLGAKQVELLENRLERHKKAQHTIEMIKVQIKNVETTMKLLVDQAMTARDPQRVGKDIDLVLRNIKDSEILTAELATYDQLEQELDDHRLRERD